MFFCPAPALSSSGVVTSVPPTPQSMKRDVALLGILKMVPRALALLLCRSGLLPRLSPFCRLASSSVKEVVERLTANRELRAVLSYIFPTYGRHRRPPEKLRNQKNPQEPLFLFGFMVVCG